MTTPAAKDRTGRTRWRRRAGRGGPAAGGAALLALLALTAAGCGGSGESSGASPAPSRPDGRSASSAPPAASPSPSVTASDGDDIRACEDGRCEVLVTEPVTVRFEGPAGQVKLSVTEVGRNGIGYTATGAGGGEVSGETSGAGNGCTAVLTPGGGTGFCGPTGTPPRGRAGAVVIHLEPGGDGAAVLRIVSG
ncbi:hypothetical protein SUDANB58_05556 [Streptomyces sp. enrichment culture]|uniref:hypothetical protein n=1 Tax=Streptomyces sp. enrichment culture TaxID=1795815 RepID=UPI003F561CFF